MQKKLDHQGKAKTNGLESEFSAVEYKVQRRPSYPVTNDSASSVNVSYRMQKDEKKTTTHLVFSYSDLESPTAF